MEKQKPYLSFSFPSPGRTSLLFKKAAEKNNEVLRNKTVAEHRELMLPLADVRIVPPGVQVEQVDCGGVPCEWVSRADSPTGRAIYYIHGGSWAYGNLKTARAVGVMLCELTGCRTLVIEYRLSPEHPYPAASDDCRMVYRWLGENGYPAKNLALFGDSAGGNLSLSLLHRLKALGQPLPAAVGLASPVTDLTGNSELMKRMPNLMYTQYMGREQDIFSLYCGDNDRQNPLISPVYGDLSGFPPMLVHVGQDEELCLDCAAFAQAAYEAGTDIRLKIWKDMFHDFSIVGVTLKESRQSMKEFGEFFTAHLRD